MISIIIPVYNVEKYIKKAFNSLLTQTIGFENLEIIFIDDNSTDSCPEILREYVNKYENVKAIFLDENSGSAGKPLNVGLAHSTKEFVMFLDSDDYYTDDACKVLYDEITKENIDIVSAMYTCNGSNPFNSLWMSIFTDPNEPQKIRQEKTERILNNDFPLKINSIDDYPSIIGDFGFVTKIYRKSFLDKNSIDFPENIIAEDSVFLLNALLNAKGIKYINKTVYHYTHERINGKSLSFIPSKKNLRGLWDAFFKMYYLSMKNDKTEIFKHYLLPQKLEYFLSSGLLKSNLPVSDILDLLIHSMPLFKLYVDYTVNINNRFSNLFKCIANKNYENALSLILGENALKQDEINVISNSDLFKDDCNLTKLMENNYQAQFNDEKPHLLIWDSTKRLNNKILEYYHENNVLTILLTDAGDKVSDFDFVLNQNCSFRQILDKIKFKYIPNIKHLVLFYELNELNQINEIYNHFYSIYYPFKHIKLITSEENLFLSDAILKSDLNEFNLNENYYFCFSDMNLNLNELESNFEEDLISDDVNDYENNIFECSKFRHVVKNYFSKNNPIISVIIPVYNVEGYLKECLDSIVNQTFRDIEIICVDDGSTDNSLNILKSYWRHDSRFTIVSKENGGLASARNAGLELAKGKYVYFIDSDDYLEPNALEEMHKISQEDNLDMLIFKLCSFDDDTKEKFKVSYLEMEFLNELVGENIFNYKDLGNRMYDLAVTVPGALFRLDLISDLRFPEGLIFEDNVFFMQAIFNAERVQFYNKYLYNYRSRRGSISKSGSKNFSDIIEIRNRIIDLAKEYDNFDGILYHKKLSLIKYRFLQTADEFKQDFFNKIQKDFLAHKEEYESSDEFYNLPENIKSIFYAGLNANDYKEFENMVTSNDLKISVIIPVYNVGNYLSECLDSVLNQSFKDLEVICVNDGSTDDSLKILENYAEGDSRVKIISQEHRGPGNARNNGLKYANGRYILFVDSDDFISKNSLEELYNNAFLNNSDLVLFANQEFDEIENTFKPYSYIPENYFTNVNYNCFTFAYKDVKNTVLNTYFSAASKLFKKEFLDKNNLYFPEGIVFEDVLFHVKTMIYAKSISFLPKVVYNYRISSPSSIMHDKSNSFDIFEVIDSVESFLTDMNLLNEFKNEFALFKITQLINHIGLSASDDFFQLAKKELLGLKDFSDILPDYKKIKLHQIINSKDFWEYDSLSN